MFARLVTSGAVRAPASEARSRHWLGHSARSFVVATGGGGGGSATATTAPSPHPDVALVHNAVTEAEEACLLADIDKRLRRKRYMASHYDSVIHDYKETEMAQPMWSHESWQVINRLFALGFKLGNLQPDAPRLPPHVIDLKASTGEIFPHVDSRKHGGKIVAALSLLSERSMRLSMPPSDYVVGSRMKQEADTLGKEKIEVRLPSRAFYVLYGSARYDLAHDISSGPERRISIVFRDQPKDFLPEWVTLNP